MKPLLIFFAAGMGVVTGLCLATTVIREHNETQPHENDNRPPVRPWPRASFDPWSPSGR